MGECQCTSYNIVVVHVLVHVSLAVDIIVSLISIRQIFCGMVLKQRAHRVSEKLFKRLWKHSVYISNVLYVLWWKTGNVGCKHTFQKKNRKLWSRQLYIDTNFFYHVYVYSGGLLTCSYISKLASGFVNIIGKFVLTLNFTKCFVHTGTCNIWIKISIFKIVKNVLF